MRNKTLGMIAIGMILSTVPLLAQQPAQEETMLLTVLLKHDQSMTLDEISEHLRDTGFWENFPPQGVEIVSWTIAMGLGHVLTLRFPPERLREVNLAVEKRVWGAFSTEFYPTYDYKSIWLGSKNAARQAAAAN